MKKSSKLSTLKLTRQSLRALTPNETLAVQAGVAPRDLPTSFSEHYHQACFC